MMVDLVIGSLKKRTEQKNGRYSRYKKVFSKERLESAGDNDTL